MRLFRDETTPTTILRLQKPELSGAEEIEAPEDRQSRGL